MIQNNRDEKNTFVLVPPFTLKHTCIFVRHIKLSTESWLIPILPLVKLRAFCRHYLLWEITSWNWYYDEPIDLCERGSLILIHIGRGTPQITVSYCVAAIERGNAFPCAWWYALFMVCVCAWDHCASDPCENGGTCINNYEGYICDCEPGWMGNTCTEPGI